MRKLFLLLIIILIINFNCLPDGSNLSDTEFSDPSLIAPSVTIDKAIETDGQLTYKVRVWLFDEYDFGVRLKKGAVRFNGQTLSLKYAQPDDEPYYCADSLDEDIYADTDNIVEIELADSSVYTAIVHSPEKDLNVLNLPDNYTNTEHMDISWKEVCDYDEMSLVAFKYFELEDGGAGHGSSYREIPADYYLLGIFRLSKDRFQVNDATVYKAGVTLSGTIYGTVGEQFRSGGDIKITYSISKECSVN